MKTNGLLNTAALTISLILGQYVFFINQSPAQIEIANENHDSTDLETLENQNLSVDENGNYMFLGFDLEALENQNLPVDENGNYMFLGFWEDSLELDPPLLNLPEVPGNKPDIEPIIQFGRFTIDTCRGQGRGVCFNFSLF